MPTTVEFLRNEKNPLLFAAGQVIFHQGDAGDVMYGVVEGTVELLRQGTVIATLGPGRCLVRWRSSIASRAAPMRWPKPT